MTHINAYFADVDEAAEEVRAANAKWNAAKIRLEAKKKEVNWQEPEAETPKEEPTHTEPKAEESKEDSEQRHRFGKKK